MRKKNKSRVLRTDEDVLDEAASLQQHTLAALRRIQTTANESEEVGGSTLAALSDQRGKLERIHEGADRVDKGLRTAEKLQDRLGRVALRFNKRAAKREVREEIAAEDQSSQSSGSSAAKEAVAAVIAPTPSPTVHVEKIKKTSRLLRKQPPAGTPSWQTTKPTRSRLLDKAPTGPHKEKLEALQDVDDEIEDALDAVGASLDRLMDINAHMSTEVQHQNKSIHRVSDRMAAADHKQRIINRRATKFMDGKLRKQNERADVLSGGVAKTAAGMAARTMI